MSVSFPHGMVGKPRSIRFQIVFVELTDADGDDLNTFTAAPDHLAHPRHRGSALTLPMLIGHLISRS